MKWGQPLDYVFGLPFSSYMMVMNKLRRDAMPIQEQEQVENYEF